jgi:acetyl-CoA acetyltransferase
VYWWTAFARREGLAAHHVACNGVEMQCASAMDAVEINEAFASQSIACLRELGVPFEKANLWGRALALGHPLGTSGCRMVVTLNSIMKANPSFKYDLATMCVGFGQGNATIWGRVD